MEWTPGGTSEDIEDRRDDSGGGRGGGGLGGGGGGFGGGGFGFGGVHLGLGGTIVVLVLYYFLNHSQIFSGGETTTRAPTGNFPASEPNSARDQQEKPEVQFVSFVLDDVQKNWDKVLPAQANVAYRHAKLVLFRNSFPSACGQADTATGPFYCPGDQKVYLDLGFFNELKTRFGAPGEFAEAYVIAHEIGHHVQRLLGIEAAIRRQQQQNPRAENRLSVQLELQADCFAGIWGNSTGQRKIIDQSDIAAGLRAAAAVGDDRLQQAARGTVNPETFTHGSSAQRTAAFKTGLDSGTLAACGVK